MSRVDSETYAFSESNCYVNQGGDLVESLTKLPHMWMM